MHMFCKCKHLPKDLSKDLSMDTDRPLRIWTFNINCIRKKVQIIQALLVSHHIDILFVTETKIKPEVECQITFPGYEVIWNSNKLSWFHGVAFIYNPQRVTAKVLGSHLQQCCNLYQTSRVGTACEDSHVINQITTESLEQDIVKAHHNEGRILTVSFSKVQYCARSEPIPKANSNLCQTSSTEVVIVGTYVPNSGCDRKQPFKRLAYRSLVWDRDLFLYLENLRKTHKNVIWLGDLNVARHDNDMQSKTMHIAGTTAIERNNFSWYFTTGWIDSWELCNPSKTNIADRATYGVGSRCKLRLDYVICSPNLAGNIVNSMVDQDFGGSDHVPMGTDFRL